MAPARKSQKWGDLKSVVFHIQSLNSKFLNWYRYGLGYFDSELFRYKHFWYLKRKGRTYQKALPFFSWIISRLQSVRLSRYQRGCRVVQTSTIYWHAIATFILHPKGWTIWACSTSYIFKSPLNAVIFLDMHLIIGYFWGCSEKRCTYIREDINKMPP